MKTGLKEAEGTFSATSFSSISISKGSNISDQRGCYNKSVNKTNTSKPEEGNEIQSLETKNSKRLLKCFQPSISQSLPELYTQKKSGCHEYSSLRNVVDTVDGSYANLGADKEHFIDKTIGSAEETILKLDLSPLQQKVHQVLKISDKDSFQENTGNMGMFHWILRIAGLCFVLLCILLLLVIFSIPAQGEPQNTATRENISIENNVVRFVDTKFKAPATDLKIGTALKENFEHSRGNRQRISAL
jgi:hypothetical protein